MILRDAIIEDAEAMLDQIEVYMGEMPEPQRAFNREDAKETLQKQILNPRGRIILAENQIGIIGIIGVVIMPSIGDYAMKRAVEWVWHSSPKINTISRYKVMMALLTKIEKWCIAEKAKYISINVSVENSIEKYLLKKGYRVLELSMIRDLTMEGK